jgi:hypothetical protein
VGGGPGERNFPERAPSHRFGSLKDKSEIVEVAVHPSWVGLCVNVFLNGLWRQGLCSKSHGLTFFRSPSGYRPTFDHKATDHVP